jgi:hypothetical protein
MSVAFKATSSSKGKAKQGTSSEDNDSSFDDMDDEKMTLFVMRFGKFMVKKGCRARRKKSSSKNKEESRTCFKCGSKDGLLLNAHTIATMMMTRRAKRTRRKRKRKRRRTR